MSWNDGRAFCDWLTKRERAAGRLPEGLEYRLPQETEWEYACRGGHKGSQYFWWGNEINDGEGRLNISAIDFLPNTKHTWPLAKRGGVTAIRSSRQSITMAKKVATASASQICAAGSGKSSSTTLIPKGLMKSCMS